MEMAYHILRTIEMLVMYIGGFRLITQGFPLRWNRWWAKGILVVCYGSWMTLFIVNAWGWFKFAGIEYIFTAVFTIIIGFIFYRLPFLTICVHSMLLWANELVVHLLFLCIATFESGTNQVDAYNTDFSMLYFSEIIGIAISVCSIFILLWFRKGRRIIMSVSKKEEMLMLCLLIFEMFACNNILKPGELLSNRWTLFVIGLYLAVIVGISLVFVVYYAYRREQIYRQQISKTNSLLNEQYEMLFKNYSEKRILIHDAVQKNILLQGYLETEQYTEAQKFLKEICRDYQNSSIKVETGITEIDLILHYKQEKCEQKNICLETEINVMSCPLQRKDLCILLGNLLDNSIEAVQELEEKKRRVTLHMKSLNQMFMIQIENFYCGARRREGEKYLTTKEDEKCHGIGLESCKKIVDNYGGTLEIVDKDNRFIVNILIIE